MEATRASSLTRLARFLIYTNFILLALEYFGLPAYRKMHGGEPWPDFARMLLCVIDAIAAYAITRGFTVFGIAVIGSTSTVMFALPLIVGQATYGWLSTITYFILFFWDFVALIYLAKAATHETAK